MYALTIWQPWAGAITHGAKRVENRPWPAPPWVIGQTIAIHAGRRFDRDALPPPGTAWPPSPPGGALPLGAVVATARVDGCHYCCQRGYGAHPRLLCSPWATPGQYHWHLSAVRPLPEPVPARGYQKLWPLPSAVAARIAASLADPSHQARADASCLSPTDATPYTGREAAQ